ncbi:MAG: hypothetical protein JWN14_692 [Chthonomonadales bacterium]|nr:hypothetical protein [Chthonomonadales bacterium]
MHRRASFPVFRLRRSFGSGLIVCLSLVACAVQSQVKQNQGKQQGKQQGRQVPQPPLDATPPPPRVHTEIYTDRDGAKHPWTVTATHSLLWDGVPYLPVGGAFTPKSLTDSSDTAWQSDVRALAALHDKGVLDVLISPSKSLPDIPAAAFQRLIDHLEANGFRYGLGFGPGLSKPLTGFVVKPANYRYYEPDSLTAHWRADHADQGFVTVLEDGNSGAYKIAQHGRYAIKDDFLSIPLEPSKSSGKLIGLLYPHKSLPGSGEGVLPDLWSGYDDYRDRLLAYMGGIKFGKGLRFLLDPLSRHLGLSNEYETIIPESDAFRLEWESWLERSFPSVEDARLRWGINEYEPKSFDELARYVPLWFGEKGISYLFDPQGDRMLMVDTRKSTFWNDFRQFRNESIANYMRSLAEVLKHQAVDVPVVYTWTQSHPIFLNAEFEGFDGLSIATHGKPSVAGQLGPALSAIEQAARPMWYVAAEISPNVPAPAAVSPDPPAGSATTAARIEMFNALDVMRDTGIKGYFEGSTAPDAEAANASLMNAPDRMGWLHDYSTQFTSRPDAARYLKPVLFYPLSTPGPAHIGPVPGASNVLWLGADAAGETLDYWPAFSGYILKGDNDRQVTVLVSLKGPRMVHFKVPVNQGIKAFSPAGEEQKVTLINKTEFALRLDSTPTIIHTGGQHLIIQEAAEDALAQLESLFSKAANSKSPEVTNVKSALYHAEDFYSAKKFDEAYMFARDGLSQLMDVLKPYVWIEGETPILNSFDEVGIHPEASGERYLRVSNPNPPTKLGYSARWDFDVAEDGRYNIWMACSVPAPSISPIRWAIDVAPNLDPVDPKPHGPLYAGDQFGWILLGAANVKHGRHALSIEAIDRAVSPSIYNFAVDAIMLTKDTFNPNANMRPIPVDDATLQANSKFKRPQKP